MVLTFVFCNLVPRLELPNLPDSGRKRNSNLDRNLTLGPALILTQNVREHCIQSGTPDVPLSSDRGRPITGVPPSAVRGSSDAGTGPQTPAKVGWNVWRMGLTV